MNPQIQKIFGLTNTGDLWITQFGICAKSRFSKTKNKLRISYFINLANCTVWNHSKYIAKTIFHIKKKQNYRFENQKLTEPSPSRRRPHRITTKRNTFMCQQMEPQCVESNGGVYAKEEERVKCG